MLEKLNWFFFYWSKNSGAIDVKMDGSVLEEKLFFEDARVDFPFEIGLGLLHYLYC